ncbi:MAG: alpha-ribazole phosphatase, partial [Gammaproteobacteria bacterium]|nr:alpha-ribazole phosphatase [Gammaproteobacteria bacterium]
MNLYLVRHPQPLDVAGLCYGRQEVRIDAGSLARTAASVRRLIGDAALVHGPIFSSPSTRCLLLARELASPREPTQV